MARPWIDMEIDAKERQQAAELIRRAEDYFGLEPGTMKTKTRRMELCGPRMLAVAAIRETAGIRYRIIAEALDGNWKPCSLFNDTREIKERMRDKRSLRVTYGELKEELRVVV